MAGAVDDDLAVDFSACFVRGPRQSRYVPVVALDGRYLDAFENLRAAQPRAFRERLRQIGRIGLAVAGNPDRSGQIVDAQDRRELLRITRRDEVELDTEASRACHPALHQRQSLGRLGDVQAAALLPAGRKPGLRFQSRIELDAIAAHTGGIARRAELTHQARSVPSRAASELALLEQYDVRDAELRQVVRRRRAHDSAADDDDSGVAGNGVAHGTISDL